MKRTLTTLGTKLLEGLSYLPYFRGKGLLALAVLRLCRPVLPLTIRLANGSWMWLNDDDPGRFLLPYWIGKYESETVPVFKRCLGQLQPDEVLIDVGANVGFYSILAAPHLPGSNRVHAFEPNPQALELLKKNIELNHFSNILVQPQGVAETNGRLNIHIDPDHVTFGSLRSLSDRDLDQALEVPVTTLDSYLEQYPHQRVGLIKIDIEGGELPALLGAAAVLKRDHPFIVYEECESNYSGFGYTASDLRSYLRALGYQLYLLLPAGQMRLVKENEGAKDWQNMLAWHPERRL